MGGNEVITEFLDTYFNIVNLEVRDIFKQYYNKDRTYDDIGTYYGISRQAIQQKVSNNINNMRKMLKGKKYKNIYASTEVIKLKGDIENIFKDTSICSITDLKNKCDIELEEDLHYIKIYFSAIEIYIYEIDESLMISNKKFTRENLDKIYKAIISILNEEVLGIDEFTLISKVKKKLNNRKIQNEDIICICEISQSVEFKNNKYLLTLDKFSSYDKKAMRILDNNNDNTPMNGRDIATRIFNLSQEIFTEEKYKAVVNAMIGNKYIGCIGRTGLWALKEWEYESSYHIDIIKRFFQKQNKPLSSREIYAAVCSERPDLTLYKIKAYLSYNNDAFIPINQDLFIMNTWKKRYTREINSYARKKNTRKNFDEIVLDIVTQKGKLTLKQILENLNRYGVELSEDSVRRNLNKLTFITQEKISNKYLYYINDKKDDIGLQFLNKVMSIVKQAKNAVENRHADVALKNGDEPKGEAAVQIALYEIMRGYLLSEQIDVTREAWAGRGPVDFKFSHGFDLKVFVELKLASHQKLYEGLEAQLTQYMGAEVVKYGIFIVVIFNDDEINNIGEIENKIEEIENNYYMKIIFEYIDARGGRKSASRLKKGEEDIIEGLIK